MTPAGFLHSGICGSKPARGSPQLFAAYHALLRLLAPRHPPRALDNLVSFRSAKLKSYAIRLLRFESLTLIARRAPQYGVPELLKSVARVL